MGQLARTMARKKGQGDSAEGTKGMCGYVCWGAGEQQNSPSSGLGLGPSVSSSPGVQGWTVAKARIPQIRAGELGRLVAPCGDTLA